MATDNQLKTVKQNFETYVDSLPGGLVIWLFFLLEMGTFALFFLSFAWCSRSEPEIFLSSQQQLHPFIGTLNTMILLTGSWAAARGVSACRNDQSLMAWFYACGLSGILFLGVKIYEYSFVFEKGISLSTNTFWFFYLFLTLLHNLHVVFGVYFMCYLAWNTKDKKLSELSEEDASRIEAAAIYWHLVDIIWIFLFPLLYFSK